MNTTHTNTLARHPLRSFFVLAFALSWLIEVPLALEARGLLNAHLPFGLHYLAGFGPLLAAALVSYAASGRIELKRLFERLVKWRVGIGWWLVALSPLIALVVISMAMRLAHGEILGIAQLGQIDHFPALGVMALPFWIATFGVGEETGWRGFALPRLQARHNALAATGIIWALWALWHTPLFFYMYPVSVLPGLIIGLLAGAIIFTWIFNSTGGSVLMTILWHGLFNYATACTACKTSVPAAVLSTVVMIWAGIIVLLFRPANLAHVEKIATVDMVPAKLEAH